MTRLLDRSSSHPLSRRLGVAVLATTLALGGSLAAVPAYATPSPDAPEVSSVGLDSVELRWTSADAAGYSVQVYPESGAEPLHEHRLGDSADSRITAITDEIPAEEVSARITGLDSDTGYRFAVTALDDTGDELHQSERTPVVTTSAPPAPPEAPLEEPETPAEAEAPAEPATPENAEGETSPAPESSPAPAPEVTDRGDDHAAAEEASTPAAGPTPAPGTGREPASEPWPLNEAAAPLQLFAAAAETAPTATAKGGTAVVVDWAAYDATVTAPFTYYSIAVYAGSSDDVVKSQTTFNASSIVITGLEPATPYSFEVTENSTPEASGRSAVVTTLATAAAPGAIPAAPTTTVNGPATITVSWPAIDSGPEVRSYTVRAYRDGVQAAIHSGIDPFTVGTTWQFTNLLAFTEYTFTVTAVGYDATGEESTHSAPTRTERGLPVAPAAPALVRTNPVDTGVTASWAPPASDGGYPITGYRLQFYNTASTATANLVQLVEVPGDQTSYSYPDFAIVGGAIGVRVAAVNAAGLSSYSSMSPALTVAATATPSTAVSSTAANLLVSDPTADGFTVRWNAPTGATAETGYLVRVVEHLPSNGASTTNYSYALIDLGSSGWTTTGQQTATLAGLESGRSYRVAITAYTEDGDGNRLYRASSNRNTAGITTTGSTMPAQPVSVATPTVIGHDSLSWDGGALSERYAGGSPITGYEIRLYTNGGTSLVQTAVVETETDEDPSAVFTGLERDSWYQLRYAGINEHGTGQFSELSQGARTLARPLPGSVPPPYTSLTELRAAIAAGQLREVDAASLGITTALESNSPLAFALAWRGESEDGETWLYQAGADAAFQAVFAIEGGTARVDQSLGDLDSGSYYLVLYAGQDTPVAVEIAVTRPVTGPTELDDAVFRWGLNNESNNGAFYGGCNYFTAGKAPDVGASQIFTSSRYSSQEGNVTIVKPNAAGQYEQASWASKCLTRFGAPVTSAVSTAFTESQIVITGGSGIVDPSTNSADIQWEGDFSVVYYGGLTYWYGSNPRLVVEDGVGTVTITASGYGADMFDSSVWLELEPREITLATLSNVRMTSQGITVTPDYLGVAVDSDGGSHASQAPRTGENAAYWGSFPQSFIDFQAHTGQLAYWYSSGGSQDPAKPTLPLYVAYDAATAEDPDAGEAEEGVGVETPTAAAPPQQGITPSAPPFASVDGTSVDGLEALLELIEQGIVTLLPANEAGIPATFLIGERLDFALPWEGEEESGVIWVYPDTVYGGSFRIADGAVAVALNTSALETLGETYFAFFGEDGTVVAVQSEAVGWLEPQEAEAIAGGAVPAAPGITPISGGGSLSPTTLYLLMAAGGGVLVLAAAGSGIVLLRRRGLVGVG